MSHASTDFNWKTYNWRSDEVEVSGVNSPPFEIHQNLRIYLNVGHSKAPLHFLYFKCEISPNSEF